MRCLNLFLVQFKSCLRNIFSLSFIIISIIISLSIGISCLNEEKKEILLVVVNEDKGEYGEKIIETLEKQEIKSLCMEYEKAKKNLKNNNIEAFIYIPNDFTEKMKSGKFEDSLKLYTSPTSQAAAVFVEPIINSTISLAMEEQAILLSRNFLEKNGKTIEEDEEEKIRIDFEELSKNSSHILVKETQLNANKVDEMPLNIKSFNTCIYWYSTFCVFYLIVNAAWILDINKKGLCTRAFQVGTSQWKLLLISGMPSVIICLIGYLVTSICATILIPVSSVLIFQFLLPVIIYLITVLGVTLFLASILKQEFLLMFIAPVMTFFNGILSGLIIKLPEWLNVVKKISYVLPGRWLKEFNADNYKILIGSIICALIWIAIGILSSIVANRKEDKNG